MYYVCHWQNHIFCSKNYFPKTHFSEIFQKILYESSEHFRKNEIFGEEKVTAVAILHEKYRNIMIKFIEFGIIDINSIKSEIISAYSYFNRIYTLNSYFFSVLWLSYHSRWIELKMHLNFIYIWKNDSIA